MKIYFYERSNSYNIEILTPSEHKSFQKVHEA